MKGRIYQIAKESGVSTATVSRVFNSKPYVKDAVRKKVLKTAKKLHYAPKQTARRFNIALLIENIEALSLGYYESILISVLTKHIIKNRFTFEIISMGELDILHTHFFDGMIAILYHPESLAKIKEIRTLPVITINCPIDELQNIYSDHKQGIRLAFDYLISRGHKKIGLFQRASVPWGDTQRREAYKECLEKHNIPFDENLIQVQKDSSLVEAMARICRVGPTALIACGEDAPLEVMYALNLLNKRVPDDISVISFENNNLSPYLNPPHTTVCQHLDEIGRAAVEEIENIIDGKTGNLSDKIIKNTLIERASVRTLK